MATKLEFIKSNSYGYSDTGVASLSVTDCFDDRYDVYFITVLLGQSGIAATDVNMRFLDSSDTEISTSNYDYALLNMNFGSAFSETKSTGQTKFYAIGNLTGRTSTNETSTANIYIYNPTSTSFYTFVQAQGVDNDDRGGKYIGVLKETTSCTGIKFIPNNSSATFREITVNVYGVK